MAAQKSVYTIHGLLTENFDSLFNGTEFKKSGFIRKFIIKIKANKILSDLRTMGITDSTIYPDFEGLANDLKDFLSDISVQSSHSG